MAHFAVIDGSNLVTAVHVVADADCLDGDGNESEAVGIAFCESLWGVGTYKQTSYNNNFKKQFARIGDSYDASANEFVRPKPHASWTLDGSNDWEAPLSKPSVTYPIEIHWDETAYQADNATGWVQTDTSE
tara:strand:- start:2584 stop:2976 length:393 start_codon:yes stop_codon:yes gene_type:complete